MVDLIIALILLAGLATGLSRGIMRQAWALAALAVAAYLAGYVYVPVARLIDDFITSDSASKLLGFCISYGVASAVFSGPVDAMRRRRSKEERKAERQNDSAGERLGAGVLGVLETLCGVQVTSAVLLTYPIFGLDAWIKDSRILAAIFNQLPIMMSLLPSEFQHVLELF